MSQTLAYLFAMLCGAVNLIPLRSFGPDVHSLYILAGNITMFIPFGFFPALLWRGFAWRRALLAGVCVTGFIECWQLLVGRAFDIDDLLLNTLGALCGYWLWKGLCRLAPLRRHCLHCWRMESEN